MNSINEAPAAPRRRVRILRWFLIAGGACVLLGAVVVANAVTLTRDAAALRNDVLDTAGLETKSRIQFTVGPVLLSLVRSGLSFVPEMEPEARLALNAVRKASVGIYSLRETRESAGSVAMFGRAEATMQERGWRRIVAVNNDEANVMVFAREESRGNGPQKLCVAVRSGDRLIVVAGTVNPEPLVKLAAEKGLLARR